MRRLGGKSALITGSARGIGRAFAEAYIRDGATVTIADINTKHMGRAEGLTGMAVFPASADADYIVAQTYKVDGGNWMS